MDYRRLGSDCMEPVTAMTLYAAAIAAVELTDHGDIIDTLKSKLKSYRQEQKQFTQFREPTSHELVIGYNPFSYDTLPIYADMKKNPHMLVCGLSQQGKSSMVEYALRGRQSILLNAPQDSFTSLDPIERIEDYDEMILILNELIKAGRSNEPIYVVVDEMLQLVMDGKKQITELMTKLLAKAAHNNIYVIGITQSAEKEVVKCKHLFNTRVCFRVVDDSSYKVVLGYSPEEQILMPRYFHYLTDHKGVGCTYELSL